MLVSIFHCDSRKLLVILILLLKPQFSLSGMNENQMKQKTLFFMPSIKLLESLQSCWSDEVLVFSHSDKFLRLSLQLISRYTKWLSSSLAARKASDGSSSSPAYSEWALTVPVEDFIYVRRICRILWTLTLSFQRCKPRTFQCWVLSLVVYVMCYSCECMLHFKLVDTKLNWQ